MLTVKSLPTLDFSTINIDALQRLPSVTLPTTYRLQAGSGNGCFGDAPGFPTYFTRSPHYILITKEVKP
jgi:hypothetical protein